MLKVQVYSIKGIKTGDFALPKEYGEKVNKNFLAQVVHVYQERSHIGLRNTQTRAEVNRTGKKIYKQKGTGGARHGSRRAPIYVGGGVAHGPRPLRRELSISGQMKTKSKISAITLMATEKKLVLVEGFSKLNKTKMAGELTSNLAKELKVNRFTILLAETNAKIGVFVRNLKNSNVLPFKNASTMDILGGGMLILDKEIFEEKVKKPSNKVTK